MTRLEDLPDHEIERLYEAGLVLDDEIERLALSRISPEDLALIDGLAYGLAKLLNTPIAELAAEAAEQRKYLELGEPGDNKVTAGAWQANLFAPEDEGDRAMIAHEYVGADGQSYQDVAAHAVQSTHHQTPSPVYGYLRAGQQQHVYLFSALSDASGWLTSVVHSQAQPYDYVAVFAATDLTQPVQGLESFGHAAVSGDPVVGNFLPFLLGLPLGGLGGYFLRKWQEQNPGHALPFVPPGKFFAAPNVPTKASGAHVGGPWLDIESPSVGGPWLDIESPSVGGPWLDIEPVTIGSWVDLVGAQTSDIARRRSWPTTRALIQSAINEVTEISKRLPAAAYVWSLDPPTGGSSMANVVLEGQTGILSFNSVTEALDWMRERIHSPHVALALFDRQSPHWPNPINWTKDNDPAYEPYVLAQAAKATTTRSAGAYGRTSVGSALDDVRSRAQSIAGKRAGDIVGVIHTSRDGLWHALAFHSTDDADDWLGTATHDPTSFTYAAYYDKNDVEWPHPLNEKIGGGPRVAIAPSSHRAA